MYVLRVNRRIHVISFLYSHVGSSFYYGEVGLPSIEVHGEKLIRNIIKTKKYLVDSEKIEEYSK